MFYTIGHCIGLVSVLLVKLGSYTAGAMVMGMLDALREFLCEGKTTPSCPDQRQAFMETCAMISTFFAMLAVVIGGPVLICEVVLRIVDALTERKEKKKK
jgi:hypothetical protein